MVDRYPAYTEEDIEDYEDDQREEEAEKTQETYEDIAPSPKSKDDLYSLFWRVVKTRDSSKVGNLDKPELGALDLTVRDCQRIALIAQTLGHPGFASFFGLQGEITLSTSASKKGWLPELFVSQRTFKVKKKETEEPKTTPGKKKKFNLFRK